jgi:epoxyqueuosine reductase
MGLATALKERAAGLGFSAVGIADATQPWPAAQRLQAFLAEGRHGEMNWIAQTADRRAHPQALWPLARSAVMLGLSYAPPDNPLHLLAQKGRGALSAYAARKDYHDVIKSRLKQLGAWLAAETGQDVKVFVDTAPLMEKPLAQRAGLGWQGKHTNLVSRAHGSWLLLGAILTEAEIPADRDEQDHCGSCRACLDICPTAAFPAPYQLDSRRCLAYLSIEHKGPIPEEFRKPMGNRVFGCDDCLAVCPWNKFAAESKDAQLALREPLQAMPLAELAALSDEAFRALFAGTPIKRTGRDRFVRNVAIALGNAADSDTLAAAERLLNDQSPLVRGAAVWALRNRLDGAHFQRLKEARAGAEPDAEVRKEWGGLEGDGYAGPESPSKTETPA